jgi:hypothetical protein
MISASLKDACVCNCATFASRLRRSEHRDLRRFCQSLPLCHLERSRSNATAQSRDPGAASCDNAGTRGSTGTVHRDMQERRHGRTSCVCICQPENSRDISTPSRECRPCRGFILFLALTHPPARIRSPPAWATFASRLRRSEHRDLKLECKRLYFQPISFRRRLMFQTLRSR